MNLSNQRQQEFLNNLTKNIDNLDNGTLPANWYFRIYYDKSIFYYKVNEEYPWKIFLKKYRYHKRLQFSEYNCKLFRQDKGHINLFGTIMRLYPLFFDNKNTKLIILFDADNYINDIFVKKITEFLESKYDYLSFCSKYELSYYKDYDEYNKNNCYLRMGLLSSKIKFKSIYWEYILSQLKYFDDNDFSSLLDKLENEFNIIRPDRTIKSYKYFEYGTDEIILNFYVKKLFNLHNCKLKVVRYKPNIIAIYNMLEMYIIYNYNKNPESIKNILKLLLKSKYININNVDNIKTNFKNLNNYIFYTMANNNNYKSLKKFILPLQKNNYILNEIYIPNTIKSFFNNVSEKDYELPEYNIYIEKK